MIEHNLREILKTNEVMLVLKDNAYGFGIEEITLLAQKQGVRQFAVKNVEEAIRVRKVFKEAEVLILGKTRKNLSFIKKNRFIVTINDFDDYLLFKEKQLRCHLAIDTGMNRFGMKTGYLAIINDPLIEAIYTHLYQENNLLKIDLMEELGEKYQKPVHIGGSMAYGKTSKTIRVGKMVYEHSLSLEGTILQTKIVLPKEGVGYDHTFTTEEECFIGICDIGYFHGLNRYFHGSVWIEGKTYPVIGKCCMDYCFILLNEYVKEGTKVEFFGRHISEDEFCKENHMSKYELFLKIQ